MNKKMIDNICLILLFGGIWGLSEVLIGGYLYGNGIKFASVPLSIIAVGILCFSRRYISRPGAATLIAAFALLFKFMNEPFHPCHMLAILMLGGCFDISFSFLKLKSSSVKAVITTYTAYALFALLITYVFRYEYWTQGGISKLTSYIFINGTMTAIGTIAIAPLALLLAEKIKQAELKKLLILPRIACCGIWIFGLGAFFHLF